MRFATAARWVHYNETTETFTVTVEDLKTRTTSSAEFDRVIVATGHFAYPNVPSFEGIETFPGVIEHAHDFRGAEQFADKRVLLIGSSYSAEDIGVQAYKMGARSVTLSYRSNALGHDWPQGMEEQPLIDRFEGNRVHFINGEVREFDAVVMCTGYIHKYPFLPSELAIDSPNTVYPSGLYRGVVWQENPHLYYLGAQDQWFTFNMFDAQAWYVRDLILGRTALPAAQERAAHIADWTKRFNELTSVEDEVRFQADYIRELIDNSDYPMFDLDAVVEIFLAWQRDKADNVLTYRDKQYRSVMTGTIAARHHTPWMRELDDSLERYLSQPAKDEIAQMMDDADVAESVTTR